MEVVVRSESGDGDEPLLSHEEQLVLFEHLKAEEINDFGEISDATLGVRARIDHARHMAEAYYPGKKEVAGAIAAASVLAVAIAFSAYKRSRNSEIQ